MYIFSKAGKTKSRVKECVSPFSFFSFPPFLFMITISGWTRVRCNFEIVYAEDEARGAPQSIILIFFKGEVCHCRFQLALKRQREACTEMVYWWQRQLESCFRIYKSNAWHDVTINRRCFSSHQLALSNSMLFRFDLPCLTFRGWGRLYLVPQHSISEDDMFGSW